MRCDSVHQHLADYVDGRCGPITRSRIRRHLSGCGDCAEALREEGELNTLLETWSDEQPSPAVWLRVREAIDMSPAYVPDTPVVPWWARLRIAVVRSVLPYAFGVVTTALIVMVGLDRVAPQEVAPVATSPGSSPASNGGAETDSLRGRLVDGRTGMDGWPAAESPRAGEIPLQVEEPQNLLRLVRNREDVRAYQEMLRRKGMRVRPAAETETPPAQPAGYRDDTH